MRETQRLARSVASTRSSIAMPATGVSALWETPVAAASGSVGARSAARHHEGGEGRGGGRQGRDFS